MFQRCFDRDQDFDAIGTIIGPSDRHAQRQIVRFVDYGVRTHADQRGQIVECESRPTRYLACEHLASDHIKRGELDRHCSDFASNDRKIFQNMNSD